MKRGIIALFFLALVSLVGIAGAANTCSNPSQIILRLTDNSNAHGGIFSAANHPTEVCYDEIFTGTYSGPTPQDCNAGKTNVVLRLSKPTNAHAEEPYPIVQTLGYDNVCYGDLTCALRQNNCNLDEATVVYLSKTKNAHLAKTAGYNNVICCKSASSSPLPPQCNNGLDDDSDGRCDLTSSTCAPGITPGDPGCANANDNDERNQCINEADDDGDTKIDFPNDPGCADANDNDETDAVPPPVGDAYWARVSDDSPYADATIVYVGDTVKLIAKNIPDGIGTINFIIYDDDGILGKDGIKTESAPVAGGKAEYSWPINPTEYNDGDNLGEGNSLELYFDAKDNTEGYSKTSQLLILSPYSNIVDSCEDYTTKTQCEADSNEVATSIGGKSCSCVVKNGACTLGCVVIDDDPTDNCFPGPCYYSYFETTVCNVENIMEVSSTAELEMTGGSCPTDEAGKAALAEKVGCVSGTTQIPCGAPELQLPFFGITQFIIGLMGIAGIYALIIWKRERERGE